MSSDQSNFDVAASRNNNDVMTSQNDADWSERRVWTSSQPVLTPQNDVSSDVDWSECRILTSQPVSTPQDDVLSDIDWSERRVLTSSQPVLTTSSSKQREKLVRQFSTFRGSLRSIKTTGNSQNNSVNCSPFEEQVRKKPV